MKRIIVVLILFCCSLGLSGQTDSVCDDSYGGSYPLMPAYPGGKDSLLKFINDNLKYPAHDTTQGTVKVSMIVYKDGALTNIKIAKSLGEAYDNEAIRVVKLMPKWIPGKENGNPVGVKVLLPIKFKLK